MSDRFFLDTNIFAYSFDQSASKKSAQAVTLIRKAIETGNGIVSYQVVQEFVNVALRKFPNRMSYAEADQYLSTTLRPLLAVFPSYGLYTQALHLAYRHKLAWYDSLIVASAIEGQCAVLFSEDFQNRQEFGNLRIENPFL
ncbi:MAG: PIN domain-containing protein [Candidatus Acidiferrales bacterium]